MTVKLICVGKLKERFYTDACAEFVKRLSRYGDVSILEVADEKAPERLSEAQKAQVKDAEGKRILARVSEGEYLVAMSPEGVEFSSEALAEEIQSLLNRGKSKLVFVIGGSLGLSAEVMRRADMALSFGKNTYSHQLFRVMLLEQLYRCCKILSGEPYHK
jgi:23S rRNA (pseudouridine1915-N3)-methyltransferase